MNIIQSLDGFYVYLSDMEINALEELSKSAHLQLKTQLSLLPITEQKKHTKTLSKLSELITFFSPDIVLGKNTLEFTGGEVALIKVILSNWIRFQKEKVSNTTEETTLLFLKDSLNIRAGILNKFNNPNEI